MAIIGRPIQITDEAHWHALRAQHIGGSEVASLFGVNPFQSALALWMIKAGRMPPPGLADNERVMWGSLLEPALAKGVQKMTGMRVRKIRRYWSARPELGLGGTPDYELIHPEKGRGILECKITDSLEYKKKWEDGEAPLNYCLQLLSYLALTGCSWGIVAALVGGNKLVMHEVEVRPALIEAIEERVTSFWKAIEAEEMPEPDWGRDSAIVSRVYQVVTARKTTDFSDDARVSELVRGYQEAQRQEAESKKLKEAIRAELLAKIGDAQTVFTEEHKVVSSMVPEIPERKITALDVGTAIPGRSGFRQIRVYDRNPQ